ncbi:hypothetical protein CONCODRAFT_6196 [Conidiobolus coronatus NRRL 28638]|uniref:Secreted protein n=1 Tax=Conidiobolus coronatus (strain ATCC 28846 / CBS 209.66 / NRRL 28638) TaxID=796925 RepID=A0A137P822_CONC2|nr:hypothetical protein CONCODRAFT_6196 [Conidiobolus coronatus NRRL 28638]|eukprot:KXN71167.1 hypothetical protein CONCODRAFT_6196 [Conidiobolus coronatus NRRL 28638]
MKFFILFTILSSAVQSLYFYQCHSRNQPSTSITQTLFKRCKPRNPQVWHYSQSISAIGTPSPGGYSIDCLRRGCKYFGLRLRRKECGDYDIMKDKCDRWVGEKWINID